MRLWISTTLVGDKNWELIPRVWALGLPVRNNATDEQRQQDPFTGLETDRVERTQRGNSVPRRKRGRSHDRSLCHRPFLPPDPPATLLPFPAWQRHIVRDGPG